MASRNNWYKCRTSSVISLHVHSQYLINNLHETNADHQDHKLIPSVRGPKGIWALNQLLLEGEAENQLKQRSWRKISIGGDISLLSGNIFLEHREISASSAFRQQSNLYRSKTRGSIIKWGYLFSLILLFFEFFSVYLFGGSTEKAKRCPAGSINPCTQEAGH